MSLSTIERKSELIASDTLSESRRIKSSFHANRAKSQQHFYLTTGSHTWVETVAEARRVINERASAAHRAATLDSNNVFSLIALYYETPGDIEVAGRVYDALLKLNFREGSALDKLSDVAFNVNDLRPGVIIDLTPAETDRYTKQYTADLPREREIYAELNRIFKK